MDPNSFADDSFDGDDVIHDEAPATPEAEAPAAPAETPAEPTPSLDETPPASPDDKPASPDETGQTAAERLYAGKFKSADDLERAYSEAVKKMTANGQEKSQAERQLEQVTAALSQMQQMQAQQLHAQQQAAEAAQQPAVTEEWLDHLEQRAVESPQAAFHEALELAYETGDVAAIEHVIDTVAEDDSRMGLRLQREYDRLQRDWERQHEQANDPHRQHVQQLAAQHASTAAMQAFTQRFPDATEMRAEIAQVAQTTPHVQHLIRHGTPEAIFQGLALARDIARSQNVERLAEARMQERLASELAKRAATLEGPTPTTGTPGPAAEAEDDAEIAEIFAGIEQANARMFGNVRPR